jgi:hypothetical protein
MASITVNGTVTRLFFADKGVEISEYYKSKTGETKSRKYTAWFTEPVGFPVGSSGTFSGTLTTKVDSYVSKMDGETKYVAVVAINDAKFIGSTGTAATMPEVNVSDDEMPF